jgi:hypothetical protein
MAPLVISFSAQSRWVVVMIFCVPFGSRPAAPDADACPARQTHRRSASAEPRRGLFRAHAPARASSTAQTTAAGPRWRSVVASRSFKNIAMSSRCGPKAVERDFDSSSRIPASASNRLPASSLVLVKAIRVFSAPSLKCACAAITCGLQSASHNSARLCHKTCRKAIHHPRKGIRLLPRDHRIALQNIVSASQSPFIAAQTHASSPETSDSPRSPKNAADAPRRRAADSCRDDPSTPPNRPRRDNPPISHTSRHPARDDAS